jgi:hypothetical protein
MRSLTLVLLALCSTANAATKACISLQDVPNHLNKDRCVAAHVYEVVELQDGTRFLDVCSPNTQDEDCRFSIVSPRENRGDVGELKQLRDQDIQIRGIVRPFAARAEIVLSHVRQLHGGSEKFLPNPALLPGFSAENSKPAFSDPGLRGSRHRSTFKSHQQQIAGLHEGAPRTLELSGLIPGFRRAGEHTLPRRTAAARRWQR